MKKRDLVEMIRAIVAEEVKEQLPGVVSEMYLKKLVSEASHAPKQRKLTFEETFEQELNRQRDEHIPEMMQNSDEGIYQQGTITRKNEDVRNKLLSPDNPFAAMYENVRPEQKRVSSGVPIPGDPSRFKQILNAVNETTENRGPIQQTASKKQRDLEQYRAQLDKQKVG